VNYLVHQIMAEWSLRIDTLLGECNRRRLGRPYPDRYEPISFNLFE
jgi:hypothetical protein